MNRKEEYKRYLKSDHWRDLRLRKFAQEPWCEVCGISQNRQAHHLRYKNLLDCDLSDLMTLCDQCHKDLHLAQENLGWKLNNSTEAVAMVRYFRSLPDYEELADSKPTGVVTPKPKKDPHGRFRSEANRIMAQYRRMRPLTPNDVRELIFKLQTFIASQP